MKSLNKILLSFDLDFTLVNNQEGIIESFNYALDKHNLSRLDKTEVFRMIGLPLVDMFQRITTLNSDKLVSAFREYYRAKGIYKVELLPGVREKLEELRDKSFLLGIITSKKEEMAQQVVEILGISHLFEYVIGEGNIMKTKMDLDLVEYLNKKYPNHQFIIIGDHPKDRALAENLGAPFIGVLTGGHSAEELQKQSHIKTLILNSVKELDVNIINSLI
jgi:phosphoglycolate phosphatase-like HAD superfamily hydrolase